MPETSFEWAAAIGAICAFMLAAAIGISTRRGLTLFLIGIMLWWAPDAKQAAAKVAAREEARRSNERHEPIGVQQRADGS